ncbi:MAG: TetR/AcrR family transcriptional regulator [Ilumatobacteraceae bacterium]
MKHPVHGPNRRKPGRPKGGQLLADRDQLLAAAIRLIAARGPEVTMEEIAAEATVSKPILYRTIGDRAALVSALSEWMVDRITAEISSALHGQTEPRAQFEAAVRGYFAAVDTDRQLFLFVNAGGQQTDELRRLIDRSAQLMIGLFTASPDLTDDATAARTWAYSILGAFQIVTVMWLDDQYCDIETLAADLTRLLWPGIERLGSEGQPTGV